MFESKTTLYAYFGDVSGLVQGAPVRLAGLDVGTVSDIEFAEPPRSEARVTLKIKTRYLHRVRRDTVVLIDSKGLLGDKILNMTLGTPSSPEVRTATRCRRAARPRSSKSRARSTKRSRP